MMSCVNLSLNQNSAREPYNPKTLLQLLVNLQSYASDRNPAAFTFMDAKDPIFRALHHVLNNHSKKLLHDGIGTKKKSESRCNERGGPLREKGVMRTHLTMALQNAVFFILESTV